MTKTFTLVIVLALVVAACGDDAGGESTTTVPAETTTSVAEETTTTASETTTTPPEVTGEGGDECLLGDWSLDTEAFFEAIGEQVAGATGDVGEFSEAGGTAITTFEADGTVTDAREDWGFTVSTADGTINMTMNGEQSGTWSTDGSTLFIDLAQSEPFDIDVTVEAGGQTFSLPESPIDLPTESVASEGEYECDGDTLTVTTDDITWIFTRP